MIYSIMLCGCHLFTLQTHKKLVAPMVVKLSIKICDRTTTCHFY